MKFYKKARNPRSHWTLMHGVQRLEWRRPRNWRETENKGNGKSLNQMRDDTAEKSNLKKSRSPKKGNKCAWSIKLNMSSICETKRKEASNTSSLKSTYPNI